MGQNVQAGPGPTPDLYMGAISLRQNYCHQCGLMTPYSEIDVGKGLVPGLNNFNLSAQMFCCIHIRVIGHDPELNPVIYVCGDNTFKLTAISPRGQWVNVRPRSNKHTQRADVTLVWALS